MSSSDVRSSGPAGSARLVVRGTAETDELAVVGADFRSVAEGVGRLTAVLDPGIYEVVARAGPTVNRRLVRLAPGERRDEQAPPTGFPAAAPVSGTTTTHPSHEAFVRAATDFGGSERQATDAGLVVVLRDPRGPDGQPLAPGDLGRFELLDGSLRPVDGFADGWTVDADDAIAGWRGVLPAGGHVLRVRRAAAEGAAGPAGAEGASEPADLSLWLSPGWQTIVFLTRDAAGPQLGSASVHMVALDGRWDAEDPWAARGLELALWSLRDGRAGLTAALAAGSAAAVARNPVLGIVAAHLLLREREVDLVAVRRLVERLEELVPGHPDVAALRSLCGDDPGTVAWPPTLLASYLALLRHDAAAAGTVEPASVAERAAAELAVHGIWTTWRPIPAVARAGRRTERAAKLPTRTALARVARRPAKLRRRGLADPADRRVAAYLASLADLDDGPEGRARIAALTPEEVALATNLPVASADRALRRIGLTMGGLAVLPAVMTLSAVVGLLALGLVASLGLTASAPLSFSPRPPLATPTLAVPSAVLTASSSVRTPPPPPGAFGVEPALRFGRLAVQDTEVLDLVIANTGQGDLVVRAIERGGQTPDDFVVDGRECIDVVVPPGERCTARVGFAPLSPGVKEGALTLTADGLEPAVVAVSGVGLGTLELRPSALKFSESGESQDLVVTTTGPIRILDIVHLGPNFEDFELQAGACFEGDAGCRISITFRPADSGQRLDTIELTTEEGRRYRIDLSGELPIIIL